MILIPTNCCMDREGHVFLNKVAFRHIYIIPIKKTDVKKIHDDNEIIKNNYEFQVYSLYRRKSLWKNMGN